MDDRDQGMYLFVITGWYVLNYEVVCLPTSGHLALIGGETS